VAAGAGSQSPAGELLDSLEADHACIAPAVAAAPEHAETGSDGSRESLVSALDRLVDVLVGDGGCDERDRGVAVDTGRPTEARRVGRGTGPEACGVGRVFVGR